MLRWTFQGIFILYSGFLLGQCAGMPKFVKDWGFNEGRIALSTSERHLKGLVLVELDQGDLRSARRVKEFQHPSWSSEGFLSTVIRDRDGHIYVAPKPNVSMLYTNKENLNTVFKIDSKTGEMQKFTSIPSKYETNIENTYGVLGLHFSCDANKILVSSLLGSDSKNERGTIYSIDPSSAEKKLIIKGVDAIGLYLLRGSNGSLRLIFASARGSFIFEQKLDDKLNPIGSPNLIINLEGLGPRGDDKVRKISFRNNQMVLTGTSFNYNLSVPHSSVETNYVFSWIPDQKSWKLVSIQ